MHFLLILIFSISAWTSTDCSLLEGKGCIYIPESQTPSTLHLYIRGHYQGQRDFPAAVRTTVAKATLANPDYRLTKTADLKNLVVVATGSSVVHFTPEDIAMLEEKYHLKFVDIIISSHSGGYQGLYKTLNALVPIRERIRKVLMLDNFYSEPSDGLFEILKEYTNAGMPCLGFTTDHNAEKVKKHYGFCEVEGPENRDHETSVGPFLEARL